MKTLLAWISPDLAEPDESEALAWTIHDLEVVGINVIIADVFTINDLPGSIASIDGALQGPPWFTESKLIMLPY